MSFSATVTKNIQTPTGVISANVTFTSEQLIAFDLSLATGVTNQQVDLAAVRSLLKCLYILCDQAVTIKTNSTSAPDDTISIQANVPWTWESGGYFAQPLAADVTKIYVTNASGATCRLQISGLLDSTP